MSEWNLVRSEIEYDTEWYTGGYDLMEQPDGSQKRYYWAELPPAVIVVPIHNNSIIFVNQYRPVIQQECLELPAGIVEGNDMEGGELSESYPNVSSEAYTSAGNRELSEETGFRANSITFIEDCWVATGILRHRRGIVVATDLTAGSPDTESNEFLSVQTIPIDKALQRVRHSPTNDATLEAILLAKEEECI
ncbi:MAG: NUDIX hydrolase [Halobacteriaceae archaeon]